MKAIINYIKAIRQEWFKVTWPNRDSVIKATIMIFIFAGLIALFLFLVDSILNVIVGWIF